jgi:GNAT superfamily N-acetyltransferase
LTSIGSPTDDEVASAADAEEIVQGIRDHALEHGVDLRARHLLVAARDDGGALVGGVVGNTLLRWLYVGRLWVAAKERGTGLGRGLMEAAETEARRRGCAESFLHTFAFQARPFYERLGYEVYATMRDPDEPHRTRYWLRKRLLG